MTIRDYAWAQRQLFQGHRVRRQSWPTYNFPPGTGFDLEDPYWAIWHLWYEPNENNHVTFRGWGTHVATEYYYPDTGWSGTVYIARREDCDATDWELYVDRLNNPEEAAREPEYRPLPITEHFYPWPAYLAAAAFITALMVGVILYLPWK